MNFIAVLAEFMESESKKYEMGKRWLAKMMGADIETFTDSDVEVRLNINERAREHFYYELLSVFGYHIYSNKFQIYFKNELGRGAFIRERRLSEMRGVSISKLQPQKYKISTQFYTNVHTM